MRPGSGSGNPSLWTAALTPAAPSPATSAPASSAKKLFCPSATTNARSTSASVCSIGLTLGISEDLGTREGVELHEALAERDMARARLTEAEQLLAKVPDL